MTLRAERESRAPYAERTTVRRRLRRLAVVCLISTGLTETESERRVAEERWTEDPQAASFFAFDDDRSRLEQINHRICVRVRDLLGRESMFAQGARHAIDAAADHLGVEDRVWSDPETPETIDSRSQSAPSQTVGLDGGRFATNRLRIVSGLVLSAVGLGVLVLQPAFLLVGAVGTGLLAHRYAGGVPEPDLRAERTIAADDPAPDDTVPVTLTVENVGSETLYDLRLVDGVPPTLSVADGSPRRYTGLRPGASTTIRYELDIEDGRHDFDPLGVVARSASGAVEQTTTVDVEGDTTVTRQPRPTPDVGAPVRSQTRRDVGRLVTDIGGAGVEFHSVREYRSGDPLRRIDWRRLARDGDMATLQFAVERSTTVVLVVDTRREAFVAPTPDAASAVERSVDAAASTVYDLLYSNDKVGLATMGPRNRWIPPRTGSGQWPIVADALESGEAFDHPDPDDRFMLHSTIHWLRTRLPEDAQIVFFTPLTDDEGHHIARRLQAHGYPPIVVSPCATGTESPGRLVAHLERRLRLSRLRTVGLTAIDWRADEPLEAAFERVRRRGAL